MDGSVLQGRSAHPWYTTMACALVRSGTATCARRLGTRSPRGLPGLVFRIEVATGWPGRNEDGARTSATAPPRAQLLGPGVPRRVVLGNKTVMWYASKMATGRQSRAKHDSKTVMRLVRVMLTTTVAARRCAIKPRCSNLLLRATHVANWYNRMVFFSASRRERRPSGHIAVLQRTAFLARGERFLHHGCISHNAVSLSASRFYFPGPTGNTCRA